MNSQPMQSRSPSRMSSQDGPAPKEGNAVEVRNLRVAYRLGDETVEALRGVSFTIAHGELVAITGPSGSGKTTLLQQIAGLSHPDAGEVIIAGHTISSWTPSARAAFRRHHVGVVFQRFNLLPTLSAYNNIALAWKIDNRRAPRDEVMHWLDQVGLADRARHRPSQLSFGQQQRVAIARALATRPSLLLLDEPTGSLDGENSRSVMDLFLRFNRDMHVTMLLVTHSREAAAECPRIIRMVDGRLEDA